jgi:hypothetical protein
MTENADWIVAIVLAVVIVLIMFLQWLEDQR